MSAPDEDSNDGDADCIRVIVTVEPIFACGCGELIRTEPRYVGSRARCARCGGHVALIKENLATSTISQPKFFCPCCGYRTLSESPPGTYEICRVCWWEDDAVQLHDPSYEGGANDLSLRQYQAEFLAGNLELPTRTLHSVLEVEVEVPRDPNWRPLEVPAP